MMCSVLLLLIFSPDIFSQKVSLDSLKVEGKNCTVHKVKAGETIYSISRHYHVELTELVSVNRIGGSGYTISIDEMLIIPLYAPKAASHQPVVEKIYSEEGYITHIVKQGETLYSISRSYNEVTPQMLREKNNLNSDTLKINQQLLIPQQLNTIALYKAPASNEKDATKNDALSKKNESVSLVKKPADNLEKQYLKLQDEKLNTEVSRGIATWIDSDQDENVKNLFALHKYAPIGSVLKVRNLMNNRIIYVKVIGKLPETDENRTTVIKLSKAAARQLHVLDEKFLVELIIPQAG